MKECPNCKKTYRDFDQYCLVCNHKLKYIDGTEVVEYPSEPTGNKYTNPQPTTPTITCPTCGSTNTRKMGSIERGASILTFGIFSKKINKTFKCNNCGYTW